MTSNGRTGVEGRKSESNEPATLSDAKREEGLGARHAADPDPNSAGNNKDEGSLTLPPAKPRPISKQKLAANRRNARRSTGPRTAEGKARSRRNALRHGLLCESVLFGSERAPVDPELQAVYENLQHQYGREEVETETDRLLRSVVVEVSHQRRAMELEDGCLQNALDGSPAVVSLDHLQRYRTTSRRALLKQLSRLHRLGTRNLEHSSQS
jgi:hypothetical protein